MDQYVFGVFRHHNRSTGNALKYHVLLIEGPDVRRLLCTAKIRPRHWTPFESAEQVIAYCGSKNSRFIRHPELQPVCKRCLKKLEEHRSPLDRMSEV